MTAPKLVEHFFRHEHGRLVAMLARRAGVQHIEAIEDAVQSALLTALESWTRSGLPDNPSAWLFRVAHNKLMGELRQRTHRQRILEENPPEDAEEAADNGPDVFLAGEVQDSLLQMLFVCCDEAIPIESQLVLALKALCGFDIREIALRLFTSEANVYKRLTRARIRLRELPLRIGELTARQCSARLPAVNSVLYLLFTEGYLSSRADMAIRRELCDEAMRLAAILAEHPVGQQPETFALLALMHLHAARMTARVDSSGGLLLLEEQDRSSGSHHRQRFTDSTVPSRLQSGRDPPRDSPFSKGSSRRVGWPTPIYGQRCWPICIVVAATSRRRSVIGMQRSKRRLLPPSRRCCNADSEFAVLAD